LFDRVGLIKNDKVVWKEIAAFTFFLHLWAYQKNEQQGVVDHQHIGCQQPLACLLIKTARTLPAGFSRADVRLAALQTLLEFADVRALPSLLEIAAPIDANGSKAKDALAMRLRLAEGLARFNGADARDALTRMLDDPDARIRIAAVSSLTKFSKANPRDDLILPALVGALKKEKAPAVVSSIMDALGAFDKVTVTDLLLRSKSSDGKLPDTSRRALAAIDVSVESFIAQLATGDALNRARAAERLALLGDPQAVPPLITLLASAKETSLRVSAAEALGALKDRRAVESLTTAASAPEKEVRLAAVHSLGAIIILAQRAMIGILRFPRLTFAASCVCDCVRSDKS